MSRFFAPISADDLIAKVNHAFSEDGEDWLDFHVLKTKLAKDLKVEFDFENTSSNSGDFGPDGLMGTVTLGNGFTFWGMCAGGDWEHPVFWVVYWDGSKLRAYVPSDGNPWNSTTKRAYGNDDKADLKDAKKRWPERYKEAEDFDGSDCGFDAGKIMKDLLERIKKK